MLHSSLALLEQTSPGWARKPKNLPSVEETYSIYLLIPMLAQVEAEGEAKTV